MQIYYSNCSISYTNSEPLEMFVRSCEIQPIELSLLIAAKRCRSNRCHRIWLHSLMPADFHRVLKAMAPVDCSLTPSPIANEMRKFSLVTIVSSRNFRQISSLRQHFITFIAKLFRPNSCAFFAILQNEMPWAPASFNLSDILRATSSSSMEWLNEKIRF